MDGKYSLTITLSAETPEELGRILARVASAIETTPSGEVGLPTWSFPAGGTPAGTSADWYRANARHFLGSMTDESRRALVFIAEHAPVVSVEDVAGELGVERGPALAGTLASIGWAKRRLGASEDFPGPFTKVRDRYEIDPDVAKAIVDASKAFPEFKSRDGAKKR